MAIRDFIPWNRQENRLPVPVSAERDRDNDTHPLLSLHRDVNRLFDDVFRGFGVPSLAGFDRGLSWPNLELAETDKDTPTVGSSNSRPQKPTCGGISM
ncbi:hypothetical protein [Sphingobium sp. EM0848]|uniref:hypothetical protein n=1 Tax=Sphingobium sp. EM0848 TaxID=2743473 RepID=UPI002100C3F0|nr:hypothetical protein [Sphingobium sp. EM0848]